MTEIPTRVRIVEVVPRDGLQSEPTILRLEDKAEFIQRLVASGLQDWESRLLTAWQAVWVAVRTRLELCVTSPPKTSFCLFNRTGIDYGVRLSDLREASEFIDGGC